MTSPFIPHFPEAVDSSMLATYKSCPQLFSKIYLHHWKSKEGANVHLHAGGAFARGLEVARRAFFTGRYPYPVIEEVPVPDPQNPDMVTTVGAKKVLRWFERECPMGDSIVAEAVGLNALVAHYGDFQCPPDSAKSLERMAGAYEYYMDYYPLSMHAGYPILMPGERRAIEVSFAHPLPIDHPETGQPILYVGRSDMICNYAGDNYIEDDKTTAYLGATWSRQWDLRGQFLGYTWGFRRDGFRVAGVLVRGVSILKTKYETQEAIVNFSDFEVERWYTELLEWLEEMKTCFVKGRWRYNLDHACAEYGGCGFRTVCKAQDEGPWLAQYFERRRWDPVTREETKL